MFEAFEGRPEEIVITQSYPGHCYCLIVIVVLRVCAICYVVVTQTQHSTTYNYNTQSDLFDDSSSDIGNVLDHLQ